MKNIAGFAGAFLVLFFSSVGYCETFDATKDYTCDRVSAGVWFYEGFRGADGKFLSMVFDRAPVEELTKYGTTVHYLPDGDQPYYPFIAKWNGELVCSPATAGKRFDAALTWVAPYGDRSAKVSGFTRLKEGAHGGKVKAWLQLNGKVVWDAELSGPEQKAFELMAPVSAGDRLSLCIQNDGDKSGDITVLNMRVETSR